VGQVLTAATMNSIGAAWETYTPALTSSGTQPVLGTGSEATGKYVRINKFVAGYFEIRFGTSGINAGTGNYFVSLPITAARSSGDFWELNLGMASFSDSSTGNDYYMKLNFASSTTMYLYYMGAFNGNLAALGAAAPVAMATSDRITGQFFYEAA
jgi:hypothetical protein